MTLRELQIRQLAGQHLLAPADTQTVVQELCGVQAQYLSHALHGLRLRCGQVDTGGLLKSWTVRGTLHLFSRDDLPLFFHEGRNPALRPVDTLESDAYLSGQRKAYFAGLILDAIAGGTQEREALKDVCFRAGLTEQEAKSLFDPWGGIFRALCEAGKICHLVQEKKAFALCPPFTPMAEADAWLELARRYFTHFGPATARDAACFFGVTQAKIKALLAQLPVCETQYADRTYFHIGERPSPDTPLPPCLFLAGFDQLMLGYEKAESLYLPISHIRDIFTLAGNVRPVVLALGQAVGWWGWKGKKLKVSLFTPVDPLLIAQAAMALWPGLPGIALETI